MTSKWFTSLTCGVALIGVTLTSAFPASAEPAPDKNGPGVARVSIIEGSAVVQRGDSHTQTSAVRNAPLLPGDYISTGHTSRAELQFDGTTAVRLGGDVQARVTTNDPNNRSLQLADGTVEMAIVRDGQSMQIDTPSVTVRSNRTGDYRVSITKDGSSWVTVRRGHLDVVTPQRTYALEEGRTLVARGSASHPSIAYTTAVGFDSFDDFNAKRDQVMVAALNASPNLNPNIAGYDNLDQYGQWRDVAGYGQAWVPQQNSDWAPYRNGSWVWEGGYGWTWVGSEPWGWAPYHYGRWFYADGYGWAWYPPAYSAAPAWSPALVGFFGFGVGGPGWNVSFGFGDGGYGCGYGGYGGYPYGGYGYGGYPYGGYGYGGYPYGFTGSCYPYVGWIPLAPFETFYPWYPGWAWNGFGWGWPFGFGSIYRTRIVNITNINVFRNFRHGGGSGTLVGNFHHGTIVGHTIPVTSKNIGKRIGAIRGGFPLAPTRNNLGFGGRSLHAPVNFSRAFNSPRFASNRAIAARTTFDRQERVVSQAIHTGAIAARHQAAPVTRNNAVQRNNAVTRNNVEAGRRDVAPVTREATREAAPSSSWERFNQARGEQARSVTPVTRTERATMPERGSSNDSWGRFSQQRGGVAAPMTNERPAYSRNANTYEHSPYAAPQRESIPSYARPSYGSPYTRESMPSYSRPSYGNAPSYSRPSYGNAPSYSRPSYGNAPSYSRGSYGAPPARQSAPSAPSRSSGGGGGGQDRGDRHGHPPQTQQQ